MFGMICMMTYIDMIVETNLLAYIYCINSIITNQRVIIKHLCMSGYMYTHYLLQPAANFKSYHSTMLKSAHTHTHSLSCELAICVAFSIMVFMYRLLLL